MHDNTANNGMWVDCTDCMLCHVACPCWISGMFPRGMLSSMGD